MGMDETTHDGSLLAKVGASIGWSCAAFLSVSMGLAACAQQIEARPEHGWLAMVYLVFGAALSAKFLALSINAKIALWKAIASPSEGNGHG